MLSLADFAGTLWTVARPIRDRRAGATGEFRGTAALRPDGEGLRYEEAGRIRMAGGPLLEARRTYLWRPGGDAIEVLFEDGRPFHRFRPEGRGAGTDHPCGADLYRVLYDFTLWPEWTAEWTVAGPAKDYVLTSRYAPLPPASGGPPDSGAGRPGRGP